jgi:hypothetical protein
MNDDHKTSEKKAPEPLPVDPEERLDWDAYIPPPPPKRSGKIHVTVRYRGRGKPLPVPDPDEE